MSITVGKTINLDQRPAGSELTDEDYQKMIFLNPTPYQQARIANARNEPFLNPKKKPLKKSNILSGISAILLEPTTVLKKGISEGAKKVEQRRQKVAGGDMREFSRIIGETATATGYAALATLALANPVTAGQIITKALPASTVGRVKFGLITGNVAMAAGLSPTIRKWLVQRLENPFMVGDYAAEAVEYVSNMANTKKEDIKNKVSDAAKIAAGVGAGAAGALLTQKIYNYFTNKKEALAAGTQNLPEITLPASLDAFNMPKGKSSIPLGATIEEDNQAPVVIPQTQTGTGTASPANPVSVRVNNKININNRANSGKRISKTYIKRQYIRK